MTRCRRCGDPFELRQPADTRCERCEREVALILEADAKRNVRRCPAKDFTWQKGTIL